MNQFLLALVGIAVISCSEAQLVSFGEFQRAVTNNGYPSPSQAQYNAFVTSAGPRGSITTKQEAAMALTHVIHETGGLIHKEELACKDSKCPNEYRTQGCDAPGQYYYGRGYIQLSWCGWNYKPASFALYGDDRLVRDPGLVSRNENVAWETAFWFWRQNVHNLAGVAQGRFGVTTNAINGALECRGGYQHIARKRYAMYKVVRAAFGLAGNGNESGCYN